jgi:dTDP-L-rhamnose 4-epimerase
VETILLTGGAGFIGSHLAEALLLRGHHVRVLDPLIDQVHRGADRPAHLSDEVELIVGDIREHDVLRNALDGADAVVHLAARVGVGQSMYEINDYVSANTHGTAVLLEALLERPVRKLLVASSMSIYGEGLYEPVNAVERRREDLQARRWDPRGPDGEELTPLPTPESKACANSSVYALTKYDQERLCLVFGAAYDVPTVALRFFNVYGPYQALSNPYTGVLAIFASRLLNGNAPFVYEDGGQRRDFVHVRDVARACVLALERDGADGLPVNIGSGQSVSVSELARALGALLGSDLEPEVAGKFRAGDIRHCFADITRAHELLGFEPRVELATGLTELVVWLETQTADDHVADATAELVARGLAR